MVHTLADNKTQAHKRAIIRMTDNEAPKPSSHSGGGQGTPSQENKQQAQHQQELTEEVKETQKTTI